MGYWEGFEIGFLLDHHAQEFWCPPAKIQPYYLILLSPNYISFAKVDAHLKFGRWDFVRSFRIFWQAEKMCCPLNTK